jgi:hypothetical protein
MPPMLIGLLFWMLTLVGCAYAAAAGGRDGAWACSLLVGASILSIPAAHIGRHWDQTEWGIFAVDTILLVALGTLMLRSGRYFPVWMVGFQLRRVDI